MVVVGGLRPRLARPLAGLVCAAPGGTPGKAPLGHQKQSASQTQTPQHAHTQTRSSDHCAVPCYVGERERADTQNNTHTTLTHKQNMCAHTPRQCNSRRAVSRVYVCGEAGKIDCDLPSDPDDTLACMSFITGALHLSPSFFLSFYL